MSKITEIATLTPKNLITALGVNTRAKVHVDFSQGLWENIVSLYNHFTDSDFLSTTPDMKLATFILVVVTDKTQKAGIQAIWELQETTNLHQRVLLINEEREFCVLYSLAEEKILGERGMSEVDQQRFLDDWN